MGIGTNVASLFGSKSTATSRSFNVATSATAKHDTTQFRDNAVSTSKYSLLSFIPKSLFEQFRRVANVYFLLIVILLMLGTYTPLFQAPLTPYTTLAPLVIVLAITMGKEGVEDVKRHLADRDTNRTPASVLSLDKAGELEEVRRRDLRVGWLVKVNDKQEVPADLILLTSSEEGGNCYVETSNIDGETNLKIKQAAQTNQDRTGPIWAGRDSSELFGWQAETECELPNPQIHKFTGTIKHVTEQGRTTPVDQSSLLLRGSSIRNTHWVVGLIVYTGEETKLRMNARKAPSKLSTIEQTVNSMLYLILTAQAGLASAALICYSMWNSRRATDLDYTCIKSDMSENPFFANNCTNSKDTSTFGMWLTFFTLFNNFVPISLYVTMEMVNYCQAMFVDQDLKMYCPEADMPAQARTSNMNGDLASIQYVFSDKTGTLTRNVMEFKRCTVAGVAYGNMNAPEANPDENPNQLKIEGRPLTTLANEALQNKGSPAYWFMVVLSVCHTVVMDSSTPGEEAYQAESPDEEALVSAAAKLGFKFVGRGPGEVLIKVENEPSKQTYKILSTIQFTSTRKRMSVLVKTPEGKIMLMTKGADNVIEERTQEYCKTDKETVNTHLRTFSEEGLRTLMLAVRELSQGEYDTWITKYQGALGSIANREEAIADVAEEVEKDLQVVGSTAIEDKLQEGVPDTIADLLDGGIKVWVLTGDKMETAINIGYSCKLLSSKMVLLKLRDNGSAAQIRKQLKKLLKRLEGLIESEKKKGDSLYRRVSERMQICSKETKYTHRPSSASEANPGDTDPDWRMCYEPQRDAPDFYNVSCEHLALIVDGPALVHILNNDEHERMFLRLSSVCKSLIACRVSPAQKRIVVGLVKKGVQPSPITLAIGDGANDVAMIQEAQIGVGISGKEGKQAVNSSDFAIAQFRFLWQLLFVHGRWDYRRMSKVILYSFYKNIVLTLILFYYLLSTGFSGQSLFQDWVYSGYNFFLAMPIICVGFFDRDISTETVQKYKWVYMSGRDKMDLNVRMMVQWFSKAIVDSIVIYFICFNVCMDPLAIWSGSGGNNDLYTFGTTVYSCMFWSMMYKVAVITYTWTRVNWFFYIGSILLYIFFLFSYSAMPLSDTFFYVPEHMMGQGAFWLLMLLAPAISLVIDYVLICIKVSLFPTPIELVIEKDRQGLVHKHEDLQPDSSRTDDSQNSRKKGDKTVDPEAGAGRNNIVALTTEV